LYIVKYFAYNDEILYAASAEKILITEIRQDYFEEDEDFVVEEDDLEIYEIELKTKIHTLMIASPSHDER